MSNVTKSGTNGITLLPCPFCGGEARTMEQHRWWVSCQECMCDLGFEGMDEGGCYGHYDTEAEAVKAWNTRADYYGYEQAAIEAWENIKAWNTRHVETCSNERGRCSACGSIMYDAPNYCAICGRKVEG